MSGRRGLAVIMAALALRLVVVFVCDRDVADVTRYHKVAVHVLDVSPNPYLAPRLYPYPPVWVWFEAGAEWAARHSETTFPVLVKLPVVAADLLIVWLLLLRSPAGARGAWVYALHPVALLVTGAHGQFDALALAPLLLALDAYERGRLDASALALGAAICVKSFPVLMLPFVLLALPTRDLTARGERQTAPRAGLLRWRSRLRYVALCLGPLCVMLVPFALHDFGALSRELFGYGGVADFGWIGLYRGVHWLGTRELWRSPAQYWPVAVPVAKGLFLVAYLTLLVAWRRGVVRLSLQELALGVFLAFQVLYGAIGVQYLLWVVAVAAWQPDRWLAVHTAAATLAATAFYAFLAPGVLFAERLRGASREATGVVFVLGVAAVLVVSAAWLASLLRRGHDRAGMDPAPTRLPPD